MRLPWETDAWQLNIFGEVKAPLALNFDQTPFLFQRFNAGRGCGQLRLKISAF